MSELCFYALGLCFHNVAQEWPNIPNISYIAGIIMQQEREKNKKPAFSRKQIILLQTKFINTTLKDYSLCFKTIVLMGVGVWL